MAVKAFILRIQLGVCPHPRSAAHSEDVFLITVQIMSTSGDWLVFEMLVRLFLKACVVRML